jgi:peptidoglycan hydrolase CwlO-like protein
VGEEVIMSNNSDVKYELDIAASTITDWLDEKDARIAELEDEVSYLRKEVDKLEKAIEKMEES